jgi:hypothetical protein
MRLAENYLANRNDEYITYDGSRVRVIGTYLIDGKLYCEPHAFYRNSPELWR